MSKPIMSSSVAFIGVGQAGGNIAFEFHKLGYSTYYINTSYQDLRTIEVDKIYKYQIPMAQGCNKDRQKAKEYVKEHFGSIANNINSKMSNFSHIFFCFSMGGGTGSGITPILINTLTMQMKDITFGVVAAIPKLRDSLKAKHNAVECYNELEEIEGLGNVYFIDNNRSDLFSNSEDNFRKLDEHFANRVHDMLSMTNANVRGNTDESEIHTLLGIGGNVAIADISSKDAEDKFSIPRVEIDYSLASTSKGCEYLAYSIMNESDFAQQEVEDTFGKPGDFFKGYNTNKSFVIAFGLPFPDKAISDLVEEYNVEMEEIENDNKDESPVKIEIGEFIDIAAMRKKKRSLMTKSVSNKLDLLQ